MSEPPDPLRDLDPVTSAAPTSGHPGHPFAARTDEAAPSARSAASAPDTRTARTPRSARIGVLYGLAAYLWWGFVVVYFKAVAQVPPLEVLAHRVIWALLLLGSLLGVQGRWREGLRAVQRRRTLVTLLFSTALIAVNWFVFIWAVGHEQVVQASLGYYINPLVNVFLGFTLLHERLRRVQWISVALAAIGVAYLTLQLGRLPVVALVLAFSFSSYGLLRKTVAVDGLVGLTTEVTFLLPVAAGYLLWLSQHQQLVFLHQSWITDLLLFAAGAVTAIPLLWFTNAVRRLDYTTVGLLQYLAPSLQFLLGVVVYGETLTLHHLITFGLIWTALALYTWDAIVHARRSSLAGMRGRSTKYHTRRLPTP